MAQAGAEEGREAADADGRPDGEGVDGGLDGNDGPQDEQEGPAGPHQTTEAPPAVEPEAAPKTVAVLWTAEDGTQAYIDGTLVHRGRSHATVRFGATEVTLPRHLLCDPGSASAPKRQRLCDPGSTTYQVLTAHPGSRFETISQRAMGTCAPSHSRSRARRSARSWPPAPWTTRRPGAAAHVRRTQVRRGSLSPCSAAGRRRAVGMVSLMSSARSSRCIPPVNATRGWRC